jgi:sigma-B regulation protein RsbU (phosphoserine phosphatase)
MPNDLLPDTYSEMAVPVIFKGKVLGVLDVQENETAAFDKGDASLMRSLANHVAVALTNARLFERNQ